MIRRPPRSTPLYSSAASDVYKRQVLANDYTLPIIVVSKVLMANDNNPHAKLYPYYFTIMYANGVSIPIIAKTLAEAELDRQIVVKAITPIKDSNVN